MMDLNDLKVFEKVAVIGNFSAAGRALGIPKSTVSRCVARLETELGVRLFQRTTHKVRLTDSGIALKKRCTDILMHVSEAFDYVSGLGTAPKGTLKINATIGFGYFVLSETLPIFLERNPGIDVSLDLTSRPIDIVAEGVDVSIRMGNLPDSRLIATELGTMQKYLCAAPSYLDRRGVPKSIKALRGYDTIETRCRSGMPRTWQFRNNAREIENFDVPHRLLVNDPGMIYRLVLRGGGIGCLPGYLSAPDIEAGRLKRLFPEWTLPSVKVSVVHPSNRQLSPAVRAFVEHMKQMAVGGKLWMDDPIARASHSTPRARALSERSRVKHK
jgi:LysR family transcriptional regulator for bpeEF and oprC